MLLLLIGVLLLAGFLRFYNLPNRALMGNETVRDAVVGLVGAREFQLPITGPFSSLGAFTFGPWYWYHLILGSVVFHTPHAAWYTLAALSIGFVAMLFLIGLLIDGPLLGLVMAFLAAIAPNQIVASLHLTQPNLLLFYAGFVLWLFLLLVRQKNPSVWLFFVFGAVYGITASMHFQAITLGVIVLVALVLRRHLVSFGYLLLGFVLVNIPSLVFQLLNHWHTLRMVLYTMKHMDELIYVPNSWKIYALQFWPDLWANHFWLDLRIGVVFGLLAATAVALSVVRKKNYFVRMTALVFSIMFVMLRYYKGERYLSYYNFLSPFLFVFAAMPIAYGLRAKYIVVRLLTVGVLIGYAVSIVPKHLELLKPSEFTTFMGDVAGTIQKEYGDKQVIIHNCKAKNMYRDFSLAFLLGSPRRPGQERVNVGFTDEGCKYPGEATDSMFASETLAKMQIVDFTHVPEEAIAGAQWFPLTLENMYDTEVKWWYKEKP